MRTLVFLLLAALLAATALGATGCCCAPCGDLGGLGDLLGASTMTTSPGDYADIPPYPGSQRLNEVAIPGLVKTLVESMTGGGSFDVKGYGTGASTTDVAAFYDQAMAANGWSGSFSTGSTGTASGQMGQFQKGENTIAMIMVDKDTDTGQTVIIIMRMVVPASQ
ncbi:MAG: hypothetical protein KKA73_14360 [Chloroflexi bacterium]|nr:hypothetical protein [Chloroflexota bacterium]